MLRNTRPDDMLAHVLRGTVDAVPAFDLNDIGDVVVTQPPKFRIVRLNGVPR